MNAGNIDPKKVIVIWETPAYPDYNWSIRGDVDKIFGDGFVNKVKAALLGMTDQELLGSFPRTRFIAADNSIYEPILNTAVAVGIIDE